MAQTRAQWERLQANLPVEDRVSYETYLASTGQTAQTEQSAFRQGERNAVTNAGTSLVTAAEAIGAAGQRAMREGERLAPPPTTSLVSATSAISAAERTAFRAGERGLPPIQAAVKNLIEPGNLPAGPTWGGSGTTSDPLTYNGSPYTGQKDGATYVNGVVKVDSAKGQGSETKGSGTATDPFIMGGTPYTGVLGGVTYVNGVAQVKAPTQTTIQDDKEKQARRTAQQDFKASLTELGLADLADAVDKLIIDDKTVAQIKMELPKTTEYKQRFPGIQALRDAGQAISEAQYISNERGYLQTLRAYGLDTSVLGSRAMLGTYIANSVAPREFEERVDLAVRAVQNNPDVLNMFKQYYPEVDKTAVTTYLLNPKAGIDVIRKQVRTAEIGAAAVEGGFRMGLLEAGTAEKLMGPIGATTGYSQIVGEFRRAKQLATAQSRLAAIEGQQYSDLEAVQAVVGEDITKVLASEKRAQREVARFGQRSGVTGTSFARSEVI